MVLKDTLAQIRQENGLTQQELADKLYVTRQAVSRWENGETQPGIDMLKLIALVTGAPLDRLLDMPGNYCQSCGMPLTDDLLGTEADGSPSKHYCHWCYADGHYTYETTMDDMIEKCAPHMEESTGWTLDESVSFMGATFPHLDRWRESWKKETGEA